MNDTSIYKMPSNPAAGLQTPFILVVDDERVIAETLALILSSEGYGAEAAYGGASALEICRQRLPDLVVTDVVMPGMNGVDLAVAIRRQFPDCNILLFSGQAQTPLILQDAKRLGYDFELLAKPVHPEEFLGKVKELTSSHDARKKRA